MANVSFYRQTSGSTATGAITFDTTYGIIYLGDGTTAHKFGCMSRISTMSKTPAFTVGSGAPTADGEYSFRASYTISVKGLILGVTGATTFTFNMGNKWSTPTFDYSFNSDTSTTTLSIRTDATATTNTAPTRPTMDAIYITFFPL